MTSVPQRVERLVEGRRAPLLRSTPTAWICETTANKSEAMKQ